MVQVVIHLDDLGISNDDGNVKLSNEECSPAMCIERTMRLASFKSIPESVFKTNGRCRRHGAA